MSLVHSEHWSPLWSPDFRKSRASQAQHPPSLTQSNGLHRGCASIAGSPTDQAKAHLKRVQVPGKFLACLFKALRGESCCLSGTSSHAVRSLGKAPSTEALAHSKSASPIQTMYSMRKSRCANLKPRFTHKLQGMNMAASDLYTSTDRWRQLCLQAEVQKIAKTGSRK